jgi:hypothetical protein
MEHCFEYNMSKTMAIELLKLRKGTEKNMDPQTYLCKVVTEQYGLKYPISRVNTTL